MIPEDKRVSRGPTMIPMEGGKDNLGAEEEHKAAVQRQMAVQGQAYCSTSRCCHLNIKRKYIRLLVTYGSSC